MQFDLFDSVRLVSDHPEVSLAAGSIGVIVHQFDDPLAYEVEFCDADGETTAELALPPEQLVLEPSERSGLPRLRSR